ncbi:MAG: efflux RND transporter periplasmic adaptor subunit [Tagaea sp.]
MNVRRTKLLAVGIAALVGAGAAAHVVLGPVFASATRETAAPSTASAARPVSAAGVGALGRIEPPSRDLRFCPPAAQGALRVERLMASVGAYVAAGDVLAIFSDDAAKRAALAEAEARLAVAKANEERIRNGGRPSEVAAQRARIAALRAAEEIAERDARRSEALSGSAAFSGAQAERNRFGAVRVAAERAQAEADLVSLANPRPEDVARAAAETAAAAAAVARARAEADNARLVAPIGGTVLRIMARPGEAVGSEGVLELADLTRIDVVADVYETDLPRLREGQRAEVVVPGEARRFAAVVREIGWTVRRQMQGQVDPVAAVDARTVEVRLELDEEGRRALARRSNMQVQVAIRP